MPLLSEIGLPGAPNYEYCKLTLTSIQADSVTIEYTILELELDGSWILIKAVDEYSKRVQFKFSRNLDIRKEPGYPNSVKFTMNGVWIINKTAVVPKRK